MMEIDQFDREILKLLQDNNRLTSEAISEHVGLSPTACQRRIKKLRESGIIRSEIAILDPKLIGNYITLIVQVSLGRGGVSVVETFKKEALSHPQVQQCYMITGEYDMALIIVAKDMEDYQKGTQKILYANPIVQKFHTAVVMETFKAGLKVPL